MSAPTPVVIHNSGRGLRRYGQNVSTVFATWANTDQMSAATLLDLSAAFASAPYPLGYKVHKIVGGVSGAMTEIDVKFDFATDVALVSPVVAKEFFSYPLYTAGKSPTSELLDACTSSWTGETNSTQADETTIVVDSGTSQKFTLAAAFTTGIIGYAGAGGGYTAINATDWDGVSLYIYSSIDLQPGDLSFAIDAHAAIASPTETLPINVAIKAGQWYFVKLDFVTATARSAIISHGLIANRDFGAGIVYVDNIRYRKKSQKFPSFDSGTNNTGATGYGDIVATTVGAASADRMWLEFVYEFIWSEDSIR